MASIKEHLITANSFVNGLEKILNIERRSIKFLDSVVLSDVITLRKTELSSQDIVSDIRKAIVRDSSQFTSQLGIIIPFKYDKHNIKNILIYLTISFIWKSDNEIHFYIDNQKEPFIINQEDIIHGIENPDISDEEIEKINFAPLNSYNKDKRNFRYENFYQYLADKISHDELIPAPIFINGEKLGRLKEFSYFNDRTLLNRY